VATISASALDLTSPANNVSAPTTLTRQGSATLGKDEFLKILVAQMSNQDPTEPQDSSTFVAELAQFSSLEQAQNTVSRLDTLLLGQATANQTAAANFIGKEVAFRGGTVHFDGSTPQTASINVTKPADKVTVAVTDGSGRTIRTLQLGAHGAGNMAVEWDGRDDKGRLVASGDYRLAPAAFDADGKAISVELSTSGTVTGVAFEGGIPMLKVDGSLIRMSDITSINERNTP
jgi:flagellar basal-body rod modification protein FlgD